VEELKWQVQGPEFGPQHRKKKKKGKIEKRTLKLRENEVHV
jgi:hypothetical protein